MENLTGVDCIEKYFSCEMHEFAVDNCPCKVVVPANPLPGRPWIWKAEFFSAFPKFELEMLSRGFYLGFMSVGNTFGTNIIFAGLDAKEMDMAGSAALWKSIREGRLTDPVTGRKITKDKITLMVNIDQIGSSLSPITKGREDYILMLGSQTLDAVRKNLLFSCNSTYDIGLDICLSYYGSRQFTDFFWKLSDQKIFADNGIPSVMFTSGITMNNNKLRDKVSTLNMDVLRKRIYLIYHWVETML
jgi:Zn-dependent M28 family amino/carboxypeptidase